MFLSGLKYLRRLERQVKFAKKPVLQNKTGGCSYQKVSLEQKLLKFQMHKEITRIAIIPFIPEVSLLEISKTNAANACYTYETRYQKFHTYQKSV